MSVRTTILPFLSILALVACNGGDDTAGGDGGATDGGGDGGGGDVLITISGTAVDFQTRTPVPEGLCVSAADPSAAVTGGEFEILVSGVVGANGIFSLDGVSTDSAVGLMILVTDCAGEGTVVPSATGVAASSYASLANGDTLSGVTALSIDVATGDGMDQSLAAAGSTNNLTVDGALLGSVVDATGAPVGGATVTGEGSGATAYYGDPDPSDGLFSTAGAANTATDAAAGALFVIPAAPVWSYNADDGGAHTFESLLAGSQPGIVLFVRFDEAQ